MIDYYKKALPLTIGVFLTLLCIISLIEFVRGFDVYDLEYTLEVIHYFVLAVLTGFIGIPLFFLGLERISTKNG